MGSPPPGTQPNPTGEMLKMVMMLVFFMVVMYFLMIRPQQKKAREHAELMKSIKPGDKVICSGGIVATVVAVKEKTVSIRSSETKLEVLKSAVTEVTERSGAES